jgi:hypothetical protein
MPKVVVGCPVKERAWCLPEWFTAVESQGVDIEYLFVYSDGDDETPALLKEHTDNVFLDVSPSRSNRDIMGHVWGAMDKYQYMAHLRNGLLNRAFDMGADYFFSLDSDIILPPNAIKRLLIYSDKHPGVIAPAVNMTWGTTAWNVMHWVDADNPNMAERRIAPPTTGQHHVVMAAMLLDRNAIDKCIWVPHQQGEDVGFAIHAWKSRVPLWWVEEIRCQHLMRRY